MTDPRSWDWDDVQVGLAAGTVAGLLILRIAAEAVLRFYGA